MFRGLAIASPDYGIDNRSIIEVSSPSNTFFVCFYFHVEAGAQWKKRGVSGQDQSGWQKFARALGVSRQGRCRFRGRGRVSRGFLVNMYANADASSSGFCRLPDAHRELRNVPRVVAPSRDIFQKLERTVATLRGEAVPSLQAALSFQRGLEYRLPLVRVLKPLCAAE